MLPPHIIEWLRERERIRDEQREQPRVELPLPEPPPRAERSSEPEGDRGVSIIPLWG